MEIAVVADTHLSSGLDRLSPSLRHALAHADAVLHAGDVVSRRALEELQALGPFYGVLGNNDTDLAGMLPPTLEVELAGVRVAMLHDAGPAHGRMGRLRAQFPTAQVIVFGHSHIPWNESLPPGGVVMNPGSPTQRRRQPRRSFGRLRLEHGAVVESVIELL